MYIVYCKYLFMKNLFKGMYMEMNKRVEGAITPY